MIDLSELSVSKRFLVYRERNIGIDIQLEVKDMVGECLGSAERREEEGSSEGLGRFEELNWEVFLCLDYALASFP